MVRLAHVLNTVTPEGLLCELRSNPLGIERRIPLLSWAISPTAAGIQQSAYQIQVATTLELLKTNCSDMWDSGRVESSQCLHVPYAGASLLPGSRYFWQVRVWTNQGELPLAPPASFVTGLWDSWKAAWVWTAAVEQNQHVFLRKEFMAPTKPVQSVYAFISADDYYKLYVNDLYVGEGPAPSYPSTQYNYNTLDLTPLWCPGKPFCLAAHAYYQGLSNYAWVSGDGLAGFLLQLQVLFADGSTLTVVTDETWRTHHCQAITSSHTFGYQTGFNENIDARKFPFGWQEPGFDDTLWPMAHLVTLAPWRLHAQETDMLSVSEQTPQALCRLDDGRIFFDFGREMAGTLRLDMQGTCGSPVELRLGEELHEPGVVRHEMRCNCNYSDTWTLRDGWQSLEFYDYRGFRYGNLVGIAHPECLSVTAVTRHYPFRDHVSNFACADPNLNALWNLAKYTTKVGTQDIYLDCPTREKGAYALDTYLEMGAGFYLAGEWNLGRRMVEYLLQSSDDGKSRCLAPAGKVHFFTEYTMYPILMAWFYYMHTGDTSFLHRNYAALSRIEQYLTVNFRRSDGLLQDTDAVLKDLVDWPKNRRDGHEMLPVNTVVNAVYYRMLSLMSKIAEITRRPAESHTYMRMATQVAESMNALLWDTAHERYVDGLDKGGICSAHASLHANAFPLAMGLVPAQRVSTVVELIKERGLSCNLFLAQFLFEALYDHGAADCAQKLLLGDGPDSPLQMVRQGATTTWEAWSVNQKWNTSLFHPAGAFTGYIISSRMMGITPLTAGFRSILIKPQVNALTWGSVLVPTLRGPVRVAFAQVPDVKFRLQVGIPANAMAQVWLPLPGGQHATITTSGHFGSISYVDGWACIDNVGPGEHVFQAVKR